MRRSHSTRSHRAPGTGGPAPAEGPRPPGLRAAGGAPRLPGGRCCWAFTAQRVCEGRGCLPASHARQSDSPGTRVRTVWRLAPLHRATAKSPSRARATLCPVRRPCPQHLAQRRPPATLSTGTPSCDAPPVPSSSSLLREVFRSVRISLPPLTFPSARISQCVWLTSRLAVPGRLSQHLSGAISCRRSRESGPSSLGPQSEGWTQTAPAWKDRYTVMLKSNAFLLLKPLITTGFTTQQQHTVWKG